MCCWLSDGFWDYVICKPLTFECLTRHSVRKLGSQLTWKLDSYEYIRPPQIRSNNNNNKIRTRTHRSLLLRKYIYWNDVKFSIVYAYRFFFSRDHCIEAKVCKSNWIKKKKKEESTNIEVWLLPAKLRLNEKVILRIRWIYVMYLDFWCYSLYYFFIILLDVYLICDAFRNVMCAVTWSIYVGFAIFCSIIYTFIIAHTQNFGSLLRLRSTHTNTHRYIYIKLTITWCVHGN